MCVEKCKQLTGRLTLLNTSPPGVVISFPQFDGGTRPRIINQDTLVLLVLASWGGLTQNARCDHEWLVNSLVLGTRAAGMNISICTCWSKFVGRESKALQVAGYAHQPFRWTDLLRNVVRGLCPHFVIAHYDLRSSSNIRRATRVRFFKG